MAECLREAASGAGNGMHSAVLGEKSNIDPRVAYGDPREWIAEGRKLGEIREVENLNWQHDIDVSNLDELIWAMITRLDPATSIDIIHNAWSIIDACRPWHWRDKFPAVNARTRQERELAQKRFGYLFDGANFAYQA